MSMSYIVGTSYKEIHWFEGSKFAVSGAYIPNVNTEVHIQHVTETFDHSVRTVVTLNTFYVMGMINTVPLLLTWFNFNPSMDK